MKENNYPSWLVPVEIAKKLREIGFDKECIFVLTKSNKIGFTTKEDNQYYLFEEVNLNSNLENSLVCIPTWEQIFEWFRNKGFRITIENHEHSTEIMFYSMAISNGKHFKWELPTYEQARETLVEKLIEIYKNKKDE